MRISDWSSDVCSSDLVSVTRAPMGQVKRVSAAIVLRENGKGMKPKDIQAIEKLVQSTLGFDAARGDVVTVTARPFTDTTPPEKPWYEIYVQEKERKRVGKGKSVAVRVVLGGRSLIKI